MSAFQALVLGIVEGLTEFLPISSTGHLILAAKLLGLAQTEFQKSFEIVIQLGAIGAVVLLYWRQFLVPGVLARVLVAFLPTGAIGLAFYRLAKTYLLGNESVVLLALFLGGVILIAFEVLHREPERAVADVKSITYLQAIIIGFFQAVAIIPGVSRSGATIVGGLAMGLNRETIVELDPISLGSGLLSSGHELDAKLKWRSSLAGKISTLGHMRKLRRGGQMSASCPKQT